MNTLFVIVMLCRVGEPVCDTRTALAYQAYIAPPGFVICGPPGMLPIQNEALRPREGEEQHVKCRLQ